MLLTLYMFAFYTSPIPPTFPENIRKHVTTCFGVSSVGFNPLSANIEKWSKTLKQFVAKFVGIDLSG